MSAARITVGDGLCARAVGGEDVAAALRQHAPAGAAVVRVGCDGDCWAQPVVTVHPPEGEARRYECVAAEDVPALFAGTLPPASPPDERHAGQVRRLLARAGVIDPLSLEEASRAGSYTALAQARAMPSDELVALIKASGLRGRGGAYFPLGLKLESAAAGPGPRYLVVNAEEGEPGAFKDRHLMESDPHALIEGLLIAAQAAGAARVYLYINGQARLSAERVAHALRQAEGAGLLGEVEAVIYHGAGGYVCGEESVILNSIEGERAVPRFRPPLPTERGLFGQPTVISNVETLANLPAIVREGAAWFRSVGTEAYPGTKLVSLSGAVQRPGLYEVPLGVTPRALLALGGGPPPGSEVRALVMGGPSGGFLLPDAFNLPLVGGLVHPAGAVLGSGGVVALDARLPLAAVLRDLAAYNAAESCGKCTPCREGTERALAILERAERVAALSGEDRATLLELCDLMQYASLCGLGQMAPGPIRGALQLFPPEA